MEKVKVSVIVPFYRVAPFIARCARSLMEQTLPDVEFIFVDDASPDDSAHLLKEELSHYDRDVKILVHEVNKGLPAARNTGLAVARGEYIWHCDSDDYPEPTLLETLYSAAMENDADLVYCDFYLDFGTGRRCMSHSCYSNAEQLVKEGFLSGRAKYNVWNKIAKRSLYKGISFPDGHAMGEDMTMILLATRAHKVAYVPKPLYHYMKTNDGAFTNTVSEKHRTDILFNTQRTLDFLKEWQVEDLERYMAFFKLGVKLPFLFTGHYADYRLWLRWFPEANPYISQNSFLPCRTIWVQQLAAWHLYPLVWLYCFVVNSFYYSRLNKTS